MWSGMCWIFDKSAFVLKIVVYVICWESVCLQSEWMFVCKLSTSLLYVYHYRHTTQHSGCINNFSTISIHSTNVSQSTVRQNAADNSNSSASKLTDRWALYRYMLTARSRHHQQVSTWVCTLLHQMYTSRLKSSQTSQMSSKRQTDHSSTIHNHENPWRVRKGEICCVERE